jgi:protein-S-isoprenylcysteine O-methyltransferase Ste14
MVLNVFRAFVYYWPAVVLASQSNRGLVVSLLSGYILLVCYILKMLRQALYRKTLQTRGPYRFVAHPAYTLYMLFDLVFLFWLTPFTATNVLTSLAFIGCLILTARNEEWQLIRRFGQEAEGYLARTLSLYRIRVFLNI